MCEGGGIVYSVHKENKESRKRKIKEQEGRDRM
jgi:hypothetical protein